VSRVVTAAAAAAGLGALHAAVNVRLLRRPPLPPPAVTDLVSVLLPARDEAPRIAGCIAAIRASRGADLEVLVGDDGSTDATAELARSAAGEDLRVRVLSLDPPPPGWLGKPSACAQLAAAARGGVLAFVDADVLLAPDALASATALLRGAGLDLVSPYPRQLADGLGPRLVQPLLQWSWLTFLPLRLAERLPEPSLAAANGQLLVCDAAAYARAGGHAAVCGAVLEDVELARAFKRSGGRTALADGTHLATCRMYDDWADLREGYTKSLWAAFGSPAGAAATVALLSWLYVLPPVAALVGRRRTALAGVAGYVAGVAGRAIAARSTGGRVTDAAAHPLSVLAVGWLTVRSWRAKRSGSLRWKGRAL
jgi:hypothetical protein